MEEITQLTDFQALKGSVITIGTFDGLHLGHQKIIKKLVADANEKKLIPAVFTFFPHPRMVVQNADVKLIHTLSEKRNLMQLLDIQLLITYPFSQEFANLEAEEFVEELLVKRLKVKKVIIGYDHRFGKNRTADINDMRKFGEKFGFEVEEIPAQEIDEVSVSSTKIRNALSVGDIKTANTFLGTLFLITGKVVDGLKIGRTIGFPTANISVAESYKLIPANGVYLVYSFIFGKKYYGMMSIGNNPTIAEKEHSIEVHFFDFEQDIYHQEIAVFMLEKLRDEEKFSSVEELKTQLQLDEKKSRQLIENIVID